MIFDVKIENFRRKPRLIGAGQKKKILAAVTYASVVYRKMVCIALTIAALNDLQVECVR